MLETERKGDGPDKRNGKFKTGVRKWFSGVQIKGKRNDDVNQIVMVMVDFIKLVEEFWK